MVSRFFAKYKKSFDEYDAFIHSYPPAFAMLFEPFGKPIITITCTRFDFPTFPKRFQWLSDGLRRMTESGQLTLLANNKLDKFYNETFLGLSTQHLTSLCSYLPQKQITKHPEFLLWTRGGQNLTSRAIDGEFSIENKYDREKIKEYAGIVHLPYNLSIMSAFEHYWQNIPVFFPSIDLQAKLWQQGDGALGEVLFKKTALYFDKSLIPLADWYDEDNFKGAQFFDSFEELEIMLQESDLKQISSTMANHNRAREAAVYSDWEAIIESIG
jgi:hypothetical protein